MNTPATFGNIDDLFTRLIPDPDRPESLGPDGPQMAYAPLIEGALDSGVWTCSVGGWDELDYAVDEVMVMVEGRLRLTDASGRTEDLSAGDMFFLPKGWAGRWDVLEDMKKIYFIVN